MEKIGSDDVTAPPTASLCQERDIARPTVRSRELRRLAKRVGDLLGRLLLVRAEVELHAGRGFEREPDILAVDVVDAGDRLRDDRDPRAVTGELFEGLLDDGHRPELIELIEEDHDRPGLDLRIRQAAAQCRNEFAEEHSDQWSACVDVVGIDCDVDRLGCLP